MNHIMPYVMRSRNESIIFYQDTVNIKPIKDYIKKQRKLGNRITIFNVITAAVLYSCLRPHLNRYIAGRRIYEHNGYEALML